MKENMDKHMETYKGALEYVLKPTKFMQVMAELSLKCGLSQNKLTV